MCNSTASFTADSNEYILPSALDCLPAITLYMVCLLCAIGLLNVGLLNSKIYLCDIVKSVCAYEEFEPRLEISIPGAVARETAQQGDITICSAGSVVLTGVVCIQCKY